MRRWLLNILAVISLLLFVATVGLWQRLGGGRGGAPPRFWGERHGGVRQ